MTGGAGFIGSHFVELLLEEGHSVLVFDALTYAGHKENLPSESSSFRFVQGNICQKNQVMEVIQSFQPDKVLNFAAESHVDRSISGPSLFIETNIIGTSVLLECTLKYWQGLQDKKKDHFRYLQVSTDEVFGSLPLAGGYFSETTPYAPNSPYSASKAGADHLVRAWHHTFGLPTLTTNCSNNYGPRQFPEKLIPVMIQSALSLKPLPVYGEGINVRDWIHVKDHCRGIYLAVQNGTPGNTYCFGGRAELKNIELVQKLCQLLDRMEPKKDGTSYTQQISFVKDRLGHDLRYAIDDQRAEKELGFTRQFDFESGLMNTIQWYIQNKEWCRKVMEKK